MAPELQADFFFFFFYHLSHMGRRQLENKLKISYFAIGKQKALEGEEVRVTEPPTVILFGEQSYLTLCPVLKQSGEGKMIKFIDNEFFSHLAGKIYYDPFLRCIC